MPFSPADTCRTPIYNVVFSGVLLCLSSFVAQSANFDEGLLAYNRKDYQQALGVWRQIANSQSWAGTDSESSSVREKALAQYSIGTLYLHGQGVKQNDMDALHWMTLAAANGHKDAALTVARLYLSGLAGADNVSKGANWMLVLAKAGMVQAQYELGLLYREGRGVHKSRSEARYWLKEAAAAGSRDADAILAKWLDEPVEGESDGRLSATVEPIGHAPIEQPVAADKGANRSQENTIKSVEQSNQAERKPLILSIQDSSGQNQLLPPLPDKPVNAENARQLPFAIQIAATLDKAQAEQMIEQTWSNVPLKVYQKQVGQQNWYVIVDCCFASRDEALRVVDGLPDALRARKPFVITTSAIKLSSSQ